MRKSASQTMFSICLLVIGVLLLLVNIGVISLEIKQLFVVLYPFVLFLYGLISCFHLVVNKHNNSFITLFVLTFSTFLILDRLSIITFRFVEFWKLWPLLIIYIAFKSLIKKTKGNTSIYPSIEFDFRKKDKVFQESVESYPHFEFDFRRKDKVFQDAVVRINKNRKKQGKLSKAFSIGDIKLNSDNWPLEPMKLYNAIGDYFIDFSKAYIPEKETVIEVSGWIGDIKIIVPDNLPVYITGDIKIGDLRIFDSSKDGIGNSLEFKSVDYDQATRKVRINIHLKIGDVSVRRV